MNDLLVIVEPEPELTPVNVPEDSSPAERLGVFRTLVQSLRWLARAIASASDWVFGALALTLGLAILAAAPVAQLLCFGYLLEAGGRVARTGRLRDGLIGVRKASRLGSMVIGAGLFLIPLQIASGLATSAELIDPGGVYARRWRFGMVVLTTLVVLQILGASARGGRIRHFLLPFGNPIWIVRRIRRGGAYASARDSVCEFVAALRLPYYFRLGLFGFIGTVAWVGVPVLLMAVGRRSTPIGILGALLLGLVVMRLPFLQTGFALDGRFRTLFAWRGAKQRFLRAPWAFAFTLLLTLTFALPLYLLKIEMIPARDGISPEPGVPGVHLPRPAPDRLGLRPLDPPRAPAALVLALERPLRHAPRRRVLRPGGLPLAIHGLAGDLEPLRAARVSSCPCRSSGCDVEIRAINPCGTYAFTGRG